MTRPEKTMRIKVSFEYDLPIEWYRGLHIERRDLHGELQTALPAHPLRLRVERVEKKRGKR